MFETLFSLFNSIYPMTKGLEKDLEASFEIIDVPKEHFILKAGQINSKVAVLLTGAAKSYYINNKEEEVCTRLMQQDHIVISVSSYFMQQPSYEYIVTLKPSTLAIIDYERLQILYRNHLELNFIIRRITELYFLQSEQRVGLLRLGSAEEKYDFFVKNFQDVVNLVPQFTIASYLNIAPETLSRIRKKKSEK